MINIVFKIIVSFGMLTYQSKIGSRLGMPRHKKKKVTMVQNLLHSKNQAYHSGDSGIALMSEDLPSQLPRLPLYPHIHHPFVEIRGKKTNVNLPIPYQKLDTYLVFIFKNFILPEVGEVLLPSLPTAKYDQQLLILFQNVSQFLPVVPKADVIKCCDSIYVQGGHIPKLPVVHQFSHWNLIPYVTI